MIFLRVVIRYAIFCVGLSFFFLYPAPALGMDAAGSGSDPDQGLSMSGRLRRLNGPPVAAAIDPLADDRAEEAAFLAAVEETERRFGLSRPPCPAPFQRPTPLFESLSTPSAAAQEIPDPLFGPLPSMTAHDNLMLMDADSSGPLNARLSPEQLVPFGTAHTPLAPGGAAFPPIPLDVSSKILTTFQEHQEHLLASIYRAKRSILITSYTFSTTPELNKKFFDALYTAWCRQVKIYLHFNNDYGLEETTALYLQVLGAQLNKTFVHSKLLVVDQDLITCGSYDWLASPVWLAVNNEASLVLEGTNLKPFVQEIWNTVKKYKQVSLNPHATYGVERRFTTHDSLAFGTEEEPEYELLTTPHQHDDFFADALENAKGRIILCAPFITRDADYLWGILPLKTLENFLKASKILKIYYRADNKNLDHFRHYLEPLVRYPNFTLTPIHNLHRKTLIVDDSYVEGSFNWLSSARSLEDNHFFMETSFIVSGPPAAQYIAAFFQSVHACPPNP